MDFAKNILSKYGWKEGDGLGKEKQGIKRPIKANLKFDQAGFGSDPSADFKNNWWERVFNDAAKNVQVKKQSCGEITLNLKDEHNSVEVTTKSYSVKKLAEKGTMYGNRFLSEDVTFSNFAVTEYKALTDEELFRACGGRTAHKGARHGLKLSGKLARIEQQEKFLLAQMKTGVCDSEQETPEKRNKDGTVSSTSTNERKLSKKSKKRKSECLPFKNPPNEPTNIYDEQKKELSNGNMMNEAEDDAKPSKITKREKETEKREKSKKKKEKSRIKNVKHKIKKEEKS